jgi:hypothetical protein
VLLAFPGGLSSLWFAARDRFLERVSGWGSSAGASGPGSDAGIEEAAA